MGIHWSSRKFSSKKDSHTELYFFSSLLAVEQTVELSVIWNTMTVLWCHFNVINFVYLVHIYIYIYFLADTTMKNELVNTVTCGLAMIAPQTAVWSF